LEMSDLVVSSDGQVLLTCLLPRCTFRERQRRRYIDLSVCRSALELMFTSEKKMLPLRINVKRKLKTKWCWSDWRSVARAFTLARRLDESKASATRRLGCSEVNGELGSDAKKTVTARHGFRGRPNHLHQDSGVQVVPVAFCKLLYMNCV
jgi:hypothetical protein